MSLHLTFKGLDPTDALKSYVEEKSRKLYKFMPPTVQLTVVLHHESHKDREQGMSAEITFHHAGEDFHAGKTSGDLYASIDGTVEKLTEQLRRFKERHQSH